MAITRISFAAALIVAVSASYAGVGDWLKSAEDLLQPRSGGSTAAAALTDSEIDSGLKQALSIGAERAIALLGRSGGYLNDPQVRIPLPGALQSAGKVLRSVGYGSVVDEFETTVNRAAEQAVPKTVDIVKDTVANMTLDDVRGILSGGDDAATRFLRNKAGPSLHRAILPIVSQATDQAGATAAYKNLANQAAQSTGGLVSTKSLDLDDYVTDKALDGLFLKLAAEERRIRENPVARTTDLLKKVFAN
jgi:hypothetical protein